MEKNIAKDLLSIGAERPVLVNGPLSIRQCADRRRGARQAGLKRVEWAMIVV